MRSELKAVEERWGLALQSAAFGVWDLDPQAQRVHYSPEWKMLLGYGALPDAETEQTRFWRDRVHPEDLQPMLDALHAHLTAQADSYTAEFRLRAADGSWRWVLSRGRVVGRDAAGAPLRMVGTLTDLTDRRELQEARLARDRAEAANRAKTDFVSLMSHELRTPLNAVLGFAQLLAQRLGDGDIESQRSYVGHIEQAGWHLLQMINDVLDLSRVESGQLAVRPEALDVAAVWAEATTLLLPLASRHGVQLRPAALAAPATVLADPVRLKQVLSNVLSNAVKYNRPDGSVTLAVAAREDGWRLHISDTGLGISPAQLPHLFEPFNRLGREGSAIEGVGIGLVLTRRLVEQMGGAIAVHSTWGSGTTVEIDLPRG